MTGSPPPITHRLLTGWGATAPSAAGVFEWAVAGDVERSLDGLDRRGVIARGLGRAYGDAAQNAGGRVVDTTHLVAVDLDEDAATVTASAGTSLDRLMRALVPRGLFVPVTPGTRHVTVGGAIAADIHGKNHHVDGTFGDHVTSLRLLVPSGEVLEVGPDRDPELFWATTGGMGLTGIIVDATIRCKRIETSRVVVETTRAPDLDSVLDLMRGDDDAYSVAWIDLMARGRSMGRSVLTTGHFATLDELDAPSRRDPLAFDPEVLVQVPPLLPAGLVNRVTVAAVDELWYRKAPAHRSGELQTIGQFWHPLDAIADWNRAFGPEGFLQWQPVVPLGAIDALREIVDRLSSSRATSFVNVLKRFGPANPGPLSFPMEGWTLSADIRCGAPGVPQLLDELDEVVIAAGGRLYLAKDSRLGPDTLERMYPRLAEWRAVRDRVDPDGVLRSDLGRRVGLCR